MAVRKLVLSDNTGKIIFNGRITSLSLKEEIIIQKSIEFFNDECPCFIHRSAVMKKLFIEIEDFLENGAKMGKNEWKWDELPSGIQNILSGNNGVFNIKYN